MSHSSKSTGVEAAGAVCWRLHNKKLQVLLIHRPRYQDWSWPKGKLEPGEHFQTAAVREVKEETGLDIVLGIPLPTARYRIPDVTTKTVKYWAARVPDGIHPRPPRPKEVDRTEWVSAEEADRRLTRRGDRAQLTSLTEAHAEGRLDTWPLIVLRHGHARPRVGWGKDDASRPLVQAGTHQAADLAVLLRAWAPHRVLSSPWTRCVATVAPYAEAVSARLRTKGKLSEEGNRHDPRGTASLLAKQLRRGKSVVICTHRPVLGTVLGVLAGHTSAGMSHLLPLEEPFLVPGELLVAHVSHRSGRIVAVERQSASTGS